MNFMYSQDDIVCRNVSVVLTIQWQLHIFLFHLSIKFWVFQSTVLNTVIWIYSLCVVGEIKTIEALKKTKKKLIHGMWTVSVWDCYCKYVMLQIVKVTAEIETAFFYKFLHARWKQDQGRKWITALKRQQK